MYKHQYVRTKAVRRDARMASFIRLALIGAICLASMILLASELKAQPAPTGGDAREFLRSLVGDWIGITEQKTDGEKAEDKYFHAVVKQVDDNTFSMVFKYYRFDKDGSPVDVGDTQVDATIGEDGAVTSKAAGKGIILINDEPKNQTFSETETITISDGKLCGTGNGKLSVSGMPLGLGKNGKIVSSDSHWVMKDGTLSMEQTVKARFKVLMVSKSFNVVAKSTAVRGSDVVELRTRRSQIVSNPPKSPRRS